MSFSHIALTVSHLPSAASFYLAALQPLGYRYIGKDGDALGFGVDSADFFITQASRGKRVSPTHVAFKAESRQVVRQCYSAALRARGSSGGEPSYRHDTCACYNAAVEDLDGHKIEFIFRQPHGESHADDHRCDEVVASSSDAESVKEDAYEEESKQAPHDSPMANGMKSKNMLGLGVAAVAGAALVYSMVASERKNARDEAEYLASRKPSVSTRKVPIAMVETPPVALPMRALPEPKSRRRNFSVTESNFSRRSHQVPEIEEPLSDIERPENLVELYSARRAPLRRATQQEYVYLPPPTDDNVSNYTVHRAQTLPLEDAAPRYLLEAPRSSVSSQKSSRHAASTSKSHAPSSHSSRRSHHSSGSSTRDGRKLSRHDSGIEMPDPTHQEELEAKLEKARDHRRIPSSAGGSRSARREPSVHSAAKASTHVDTTSYWPAGVPLPPSVSGYSVAPSKTSRHSARLRPASYYESAVEVPLPGSTTSRSNYTASRARAVPLPESHAGVEDWEDEAGSDWDNDDNITVAELAPHDSISCVGLPRQEPRRRRHRSHRSSSQKDDAESSTSRYQDAPSRHSHHRERRELEVVEESADDQAPRFVPLLRRLGAAAVSGSRTGSVTRHSVMTVPIRTRTPVQMRRSGPHSYTR